MKLFILTFGCLWAFTQPAYVYEKPRDVVLLNQNTVAENFGQFISNYGADAEEDVVAYNEQTTSLAKSEPRRKECSSKCFCGTPNVNRIVGGTQVRQNKYPWTAQLVKGRHYPRLFCGGSLINDRYVLTASHCVHNNRDQITVRLLQLDRSSRDPGITRQEENSKSLPCHGIQDTIATLDSDARDADNDDGNDNDDY
ncbi:hypothetical protein DOY81_010344 [Sarcophaga bullata]|nr:hypothetical protein DOY81_010344 [Sarcophaga bullata]